MAAESVVQFVVEKLGDALIQEIILLKDVRKQFERLQKELVSITGFLKTADAKHSNDPNIRIWVSDVRDIAYDIDDVIDAFFIKFVWKEKECSLLRRGARRARKITDAHHIGKEIEAIFSRIDDISRRRNMYGITSMFERGETSASTANNEVRLRRSYAHATDEDLVGLDEEIHALVEQLVKEEERRQVITIYGMGGLGKTTLAKKVYHRKDVTNNFDCQAWTFISQECRVNDLLQDILRQVSPRREAGDMKEVELVEKLSVILGEKRYLVVLDDIWRVDHWDMLKSAFPSGKSGSKVMLTTRNKEIGVHADPWGFHVEPRLLTADEAWNLICKRVFQKVTVDPSSSLSSEFEICGREMASKCSGLPLAVVVLAGILATKNSQKEWETVSKDLAIYMSQGQAGVMAVLALSYTDLPYHLKPFFLFLGLFPEDHHISAKQLIRMWITESMINEVQGDSITMEDVGRRHLDELIRRCMVQITETDLQGRAKRCQLHDKMRDLSIAKGGEENFFEIVGRAAPSNYLATAAGSRKLRRCAIILEDERYVFPQHLTPQLRTVFFVGTVRHELNIVGQYFKLVKVLQFQGVIFGSIGLEAEFCGVIGYLTNLRYLGLKDTYLGLLPSSLGNLVSLQTLDLRGTSIIHFPNVIWRMRQLRDLYLPAVTMNSVSLRMETLTKLQTLCPIKAGLWIADEDLVKMTNLNKLVIYDLATIQLEKVIDIIVAKLDKLISLSLGMKLHGKFSKLDQLLQKQNLLSLTLEGRIWSNPSSWPLNITKLILKESKLMQDPMATLQMLQKLAHLILETAYYGTNMVCSEKGFPQLEYLRMKNIKYLVEWRVEEGAMPCLTTCEIHYCDSLKMVPRGFKYVTTLQKLWITENAVRTDKLEERVKEGGEDWDSIKNIHSVIVENH